MRRPMPRRIRRPPLVRMFVSSTFRDMRAERDILATRVYPQLERFLQQYGVWLEVVDLRWGIPQAQVEAGLVVRQCRRQIDASRPFFLGLLGSRYGTRICKLGERGEHSVTEDEIRYGVFRRKADRAGSVFLIRRHDAAALVPPPFQDDYLDSLPEDARATESLRARVCGSTVRWAEYGAEWRAKEALLVPDEGFVKQAVEIIIAELRERLQLPREAEPIEPHARARSAQSVASMRAMRRTWTARNEVLEVDAMLRKQAGRILALRGDDSERMYATALAALRLRARRGDQTLALDGRFWTEEVGADRVLAYLRTELVHKKALPKRALDPSESPEPRGFIEQIEAIARQLVRPTTILLSHPESLLPRRYLDGARWLPRLRRTKLRVLLCGSGSAQAPHYELAPLSPSGTRNSIVHACRADGRELDRSVVKRASGCIGLSASVTTRLFTEVLRGVSSADELGDRAARMLDFASLASPVSTVGEFLSQLFPQLERDLGREAVHAVVPFISTTRTGLLDHEIEQIVPASMSWRAVAIARRLRRILDVSEGRIRVVGGHRSSPEDVSAFLTGPMLARAAMGDHGVASFQRLHARVADRYGKLPALAVCARDLIWHLVQAGDKRSIARAAALGSDPAHLHRWTQAASPSEIDADYIELIEAMTVGELAAPAIERIASWRVFARGAYERLRDPALDPWQTACMEGMVSAKMAARRTRFNMLAVPELNPSSLFAGRIGVVPDVTRCRLRGSDSMFLIERMRVLERFDPVSGLVQLASILDWRSAQKARSISQGIGHSRVIRTPLRAGRARDIEIWSHRAEPIVLGPQGQRAIPQCADSIVAACGSDLCGLLLGDTSVFACWDLTKLRAAPAPHDLAPIEMRDAARVLSFEGLPAQMGAFRAASWGVDGHRILFSMNTTAMRRDRVAGGMLWRLTECSRGRLLGTHHGIVEERTGRLLLKGAVGDIAAHGSGSVLAVARESRLHEIDLLDIDALIAGRAARSAGAIQLPRGMRHGFRALHWVSPTELVIGMCEPEGPEGQIGCWDIRTGAWKWRELLSDFPHESQVMGMEISNGPAKLVAASIHLASTVLVLHAHDGTRKAALRIHDSGGMLHMVSIDAAGDTVATIDRNGYCEMWSMTDPSACTLRIALPFGALTSFLNLGLGVLLGTEGGRVLGIMLLRANGSKRSPRSRR
jgi:hypothetical protein